MDKLERARKEISNVFTDTSVPIEVTIERLEDLRLEIESYINTLEFERKETG